MNTEMAGTAQIQGVPGRIYPYLGSAFLISMVYIDPAKWATAIEGGSRFGFELVWLLVLSNLVAILCQSLASRIGVVTGKHLAEICAEEYPQPVCLLLWLQCEASVLALNSTMILGTAVGFNLLLDMDMSLCLVMSTIDALLFPILFLLLGMRRAEVLSVIVSGLILFSVVGTLSTEENVTFIMNGMLPKVRRESLYMAVGLLGANIMPHNFYLHSTIVQEQKNMESIPIGTLCHYNVLEIIIAFSGILLVNLALLSSAAMTFHNAGLEVLTFQDAQPLIEQVFKSSIPLIAFLVGIYCASHFSTLTGTVGAQVALEGFLGLHPNIWFHRILVKVGAVVLAMVCLWNTEVAGIYQLLIFSQVMLAMQLPSAVIPLFRVASANSIMGAHKISFVVEVMAWLSFFLMLILNLSLVLEMCFWDGEGMGSLRWNFGTGMAVPLVLVLMVAVVSFGLMLWLIATPLRSANEKPEIKLWINEPMTSYEHPEYFVSKKTDTEGTKSEDVSWELVETSGNKEVKSDEPLADTDFKIRSEKIEEMSITSLVQEGGFSSLKIVPNVDLTQPPDLKSGTGLLSPDFSTSSKSAGMELSSRNMPGTTLNSLSTDSVPNVVKSSQGASETSTVKEIEVEPDTELEKYDDDGDAWEHDDVLMGMSESVSSLTYEEPESGRSLGGKSDDGGSGNGSLSRLSGLGRAARRQFAAVLDEFWGKLFDYYGNLTKEAKLKRLDLALGMEAIQTRANLLVGREPKYLLEQQRMVWQKGSANEHSSRADSWMQTGEHLSGMHSSLGTNMRGAASASWATSLLSQDSYARQAIPSFSGTERRYSSLHLPAYHNKNDYQPATIHGYQIPSYMGRSGTQTEGNNTLGSHIEPQPRDGCSFQTHIDDSMRNVAVGSCFDELRGHRFQNAGYESHVPRGGQSSYGNSLSSRSYLRSHENGQYAGQTKQYHSLPDISGRSTSQWDLLTDQEPDQLHPLVNRATGELDMGYGSLGSPSHRMGFRQSPVSRSALYNDRINSQVGQIPLAFDELSPSQLHKDAFSLLSTSNVENNSLWSRQPFEQLFGMPGTGSGGLRDSDRSAMSRNISSTAISCVDSEVEMLQSLRYCIAKLLRLDGSDWLFRLHGGLDEELIDLVASREQVLHDADDCESYRLYNSDAQNQYQNRKSGSGSRSNESSPFAVSVSSVPHCGEGCVWESSLVVSFGVWCIRRILELSLMESRPELWGKYTYVLNRLQGILGIAFFKPRHVLPPCFCLDIPSRVDLSGRKMGYSVGSFSNEASAPSCQIFSQMQSSNIKGKGASASVFLEIIKDVELAVASRKGRTGTAAGDVAFPKGKENLASVLKRYKRRLANKPQGILENNGGSRKVLG